MHKLLERQIRKLGDAATSPRLAEFLAAVDAAYTQADRDRSMVERSLELASEELLQRNRELREDIERCRKLELELAQAEKLRAVGQLASGIAHELNTPIQYVGDNLAFLKKAFEALSGFVAQVQGQEPGREQGKANRKLEFVQQQIPGALTAALEGCDRVAEIVSAMKEFAHPDCVDFVAADINRSLTATLAVARNAVKAVADVELALGELPMVECRVGDLNQVFLNLIINAAHAIADRQKTAGHRGRIQISTRLAEDRVIVQVSDDGCGMPDEVQRRVFEPFFTTKEVGRGTGQGLALSRSIVVRHAGALTFQSVPGAGTTFSVEIPLCATPARAAHGLSESGLDVSKRASSRPACRLQCVQCSPLALGLPR